MSDRSLCRICPSQWASSTLRLPARLAWRNALEKASSPTRFSLPATASRLISAIAFPFPGDGLRFQPALVPHALGRMKPPIATVCFQRRPVRRHPARPAKLAEPAELDRFGGPRRDRQFGVPIKLLAVVKEYEISERLAQVAGRQEADILRQ